MLTRSGQDLLSFDQMNVRSTISLTVPGRLEFRSVAVRVVAEACRMVSGASVSDEHSVAYEVRHPFDTAFVSAFMEIFNNIAIHAYQRRGSGNIEVRAVLEPNQLTVELRDTGGTFDVGSVPTPALDALPEGGMGIHIARTMLDEVEYIPGPPINLWRLKKQLATAPFFSAPNQA